MDPELVKGAQVNNEIELFLQVSQTPSEIEKFKSDLLTEQHKRFQAMQGDLDDCEQLVGTWNPANQIKNIYESVDGVYDEIDKFNHSNDAKNDKPGMMSAEVRRDTIATKAKQFNTDLQTLENKFKMMEDVSFEQKKVQLVFGMTEKALEQKAHLNVILERLHVIEKMNQDSPDLEARLQAII